jgi:hypothetical protein
MPNGQQSKPRSKSRGRPTMNSTEDFRFGSSIGEGSYSTARPLFSHSTSCPCMLKYFFFLS